MNHSVWTTVRALLVFCVFGCSSTTSDVSSGHGGAGASGGSTSYSSGGNSTVALGGSAGVPGASASSGAGGGPATIAAGGASSGGRETGAGGLPSRGGFQSIGGDAAGGGSGAGTGGAPSGAGGAAGAASGGAPSGSGGVGAGAGGGMPSCSSNATLAPGQSTRTLNVGGVSRSYVVHVPTTYSGKAAAPLVVDFHPNLENASFEELNSGYLALSDQDGFVIAYPQGIDNSWNVGACCTTSRTVDDLGFAKALVSDIESIGCIDTKRVYATGYSMGGGMSLYLACNAADVFATVAAAAYDLYNDMQEPCHPSRPISVLTFRGTADPIETYAGGDSMPPNGLPVVIHRLGAVGTFNRWAMLDSCTDATPTSGAGGCQTDSQCAGGVEVTLCTTQGGGHVTGDANTGWAMMKKHPMP